MREVLQDVYDVPGLRELMTDVRSRRVRVVDVETPTPSPFARSLLFGYVGMFLYETDTPLAERRAAALSLDSSLLAELLGSEAIRELLDADVVAEVERSLQRLDPDRHARHAEDADRKSTRLNSSHANISYPVFCLNKKKTTLNSSSHQND